MIAVTNRGNIELLRERLGSDATTVEFVDSSGFLTTPLAALEAFRTLFDARLAGDAAWVRVLGEPVWADRSDDDVRLWTRFESLLNLVFSAYPLTAACPYDVRSVAPEIIREAHLTHPHTLSDDGISPSPDYTNPGGFALARFS